MNMSCALKKWWRSMILKPQNRFFDTQRNVGLVIVTIETNIKHHTASMKFHVPASMTTEYESICGN